MTAFQKYAMQNKFPVEVLLILVDYKVQSLFSDMVWTHKILYLEVPFPAQQLPQALSLE